MDNEPVALSIFPRLASRETDIVLSIFQTVLYGVHNLMTVLKLNGIQQQRGQRPSGKPWLLDRFLNVVLGFVADVLLFLGIGK